MSLSPEPSPIELVLDEARALALETGGERAGRAVSPVASLERDVGFGSLEKVELITRIERRAGCTLPDGILQAETCEEIASALSGAPRAASAPASIQRNQEIEPLIQTGPQGLAPTVDRALAARAEEAPDRVTVFLSEDDAPERDITYGELSRGASQIAAGLAARGISRGDAVALMLPTSFEFLRAFQGTLLLGAIAVPIYPPVRLDRLAEYAQRQGAILRSAGVRIMITIVRAKPIAAVLKSTVPTLKEVVSGDELVNDPHARLRMSPQSRPEDPAFIQYTSGSTGNPKGVLLTHANLIANIRGIGFGLDGRPMEMGVSWLPLYHDMGLIGSWLFTMASAYPLALRSPLSFLARPERWLQDIHRRRGTLSAAPNFAYELCVRRIRDEDIEGIDLSSWKCALNGAEPVRPETIDRFVQRFGKYGFRREAMMPVFGLAECSVGLSFPPVLRGPKVDRVDRASFEKGHASKAMGDDPGANLFVSVGRALPDHEIKVVDDAGVTLPDREVGRLLFRGPSMTAGYYKNEEATAAIRREGGFFDSGDLAYIAEGELYIAGRLKDLIIRGGRNLVAAEVEEAASEVIGVRKGCVAAFGVTEARSGTEQVVIVAETKARSTEERDSIEGRIIERVTQAIGAPPDIVRLVQPGSVLKTSSGKIRRNDTKALFLSGGLGRERSDSVLARLKMGGLLLRSAGERLLRDTALFLRGALFLLTLMIYAPLSWIALSLLPPRAARRFERCSAMVALRLLTKEASVTGQVSISPGRAALLVCNHSSYLDVIVLRALLCEDFVFVAKREVRDYPFIGRFIRRSGHISVERSDVQRGAADASSVTAALNTGQSVLVFPEGTFTHADGVRPFRLGAFRAAADAGCPIIPLALMGTRKMLREGHRVPRKGSLSLWVGEPLIPQGESFRDLVALRDRTRNIIGAQTGEAILDLVSAGVEQPW
ncbi:MAG: AMP-binding protein [Vicinamibacteria bacterium]|nr:AMP-binding protein [Vicinamibacteria bacterium]